MSNNQMMEYVYHPEDSPEDFRQVRIYLNVESGGAKLSVTLEPEADMTKADVENVLRYLEQASLKRMNICLWTDCTVVVRHEEKKFKVELEGTVSVKELVQI